MSEEKNATVETRLARLEQDRDVMIARIDGVEAAVQEVATTQIAMQSAINRSLQSNLRQEKALYDLTKQQRAIIDSQEETKNLLRELIEQRRGP